MKSLSPNISRWPDAAPAVFLDVAGQAFQMPVCIHQDGFEPLKKTKPEVFSAEVEINGMADVDPFDDLAEVRLGCFNQQVMVIGHQTAVNAKPEALRRFAKIFQKLFAVPAA
jgi:hypothetical protein